MTIPVITKDRIKSHVEWKRPFSVYGEPIWGGQKEVGGDKLFVVETGHYHRWVLYVYSELTGLWYANAAMQEWSKQSHAGKAAHLTRPRNQEYRWLSINHMNDLVKYGVGYEVVKKFNASLGQKPGPLLNRILTEDPTT
jgi:hypothetical protein